VGAQVHPHQNTLKTARTSSQAQTQTEVLPLYCMKRWLSDCQAQLRKTPSIKT